MNQNQLNDATYILSRRWLTAQNVQKKDRKGVEIRQICWFFGLAIISHVVICVHFAMIQDAIDAPGNGLLNGLKLFGVF
jgi:hypothetical protein